MRDTLQVAAGMEVPVRVEVFAIAEELEEDGGIGKLRHNLEIVAETEIFHLPITANILFTRLARLLS